MHCPDLHTLAHAAANADGGAQGVWDVRHPVGAASLHSTGVTQQGGVVVGCAGCAECRPQSLPKLVQSTCVLSSTLSIYTLSKSVCLSFEFASVVERK